VCDPGKYAGAEINQKSWINSKIAGMQKERYFTLETIQAKSQELLESVADFRKKHSDIRFQPSRAALLILDLQEYFLQESSHAFIPSAAAIVPGVLKLLSAFTAAEFPVIATRHVNTSEDAGMMSKWWREMIKSNTAYSQIITNLNSPKIKFIHKTQYDAFFQTTLESTLHQHNVTQVVICGVMTHLCCETTARSAFMRGFEVFFTVDGTATYNEQLHRASLLNLSHGFAIPSLIEELVCKIESKQG
jgi:isochorismate hydrolase